MTARMPIRVRLTIWYGFLFSVTLIVFGLLLYFGLRWRLYGAFDEQLDTQADLVLSTIRYQPDGLILEFQDTDLNEQEYFVRIVDPNGAILGERGSGASDVDQDKASFDHALTGVKSFRSFSAGGDEQLRILSLPIRSPNGDAIVGVLEVGLNRNDLDQTLDQLAVALVLLIPVATLVAIGGGYLLSSRVLQPVVHITNLAQGFGERDLHARLRLELPEDEVGRLASTFNAMLDRIEHAFNRQRRFTSDAAHELRTPISMMRSEVDLALTRPRSANAYREALEGVDGDLSRLTVLTEALLSLARLEGPETNPDRMTFDLAETIRAVLATYENTARSKGIVLHRTLVSTNVTADEDMIIQVLVNLMDNAIAHTPEAGSITVGCKPVVSAVNVWVSDTGTGISLEDQPRIFDRFYRPDRGRARDRGGTGLGLAISKAIVEAHGGVISLTSVVDEGTTVMIQLPDDSG